MSSHERDFIIYEHWITGIPTNIISSPRVASCSSLCSRATPISMALRYLAPNIMFSREKTNRAVIRSSMIHKVQPSPKAATPSTRSFIQNKVSSTLSKFLFSISSRSPLYFFILILILLIILKLKGRSKFIKSNRLSLSSKLMLN